MKKFAQSLPQNSFDILEEIRKDRNLSNVQELIRAVIIPEWVALSVRRKIVAPGESGETADLEARHS